MNLGGVQLTYDVPQWLLRVQRLQQELEQTRLERDTARAGEASWRQRYQEERQQHQSEAEQARQTIAALEAKLQPAMLESLDSVDLLRLKVELEQCQSLEELQAKLAEALQRYETPQAVQAGADEVTRRLNTVTGPGRSFVSSLPLTSGPLDLETSSKLEAV